MWLIFSKILTTDIAKLTHEGEIYEVFCELNSLWLSDTIWCRRSWSTLAQVMACCLMAPSRYLIHCCLIICEVLYLRAISGNAQGMYFDMSLKLINLKLQPVPMSQSLVTWTNGYWDLQYHMRPQWVNSSLTIFEMIDDEIEACFRDNIYQWW